jgi:hypothetical protein
MFAHEEPRDVRWPSTNGQSTPDLAKACEECYQLPDYRDLDHQLRLFVELPVLGNSRQADDIDALRSTLVSRILQHERLPDLMILRRLTISFEEWV